MRRTADEIRGLDSGIVRIGTVSSVSCHWLPGIIRTFWQKHPNIQIVLHQGDYTSIPEWVRTGAVDFGFVNPHAVKGMETTIIKSAEKSPAGREKVTDTCGLSRRTVPAAGGGSVQRAAGGISGGGHYPECEAACP